MNTLVSEKTDGEWAKEYAKLREKYTPRQLSEFITWFSSFGNYLTPSWKEMVEKAQEILGIK